MIGAGGNWLRQLIVPRKKSWRVEVNGRLDVVENSGAIALGC